MREPAGHRLLLLALVFGLPSIARAGLVWESSWKVTSDDGKYLLVFVSPHPVDEDARSPVDEPRVREIRSKYQQSGLYRNDGSTEPLWLIPYHIPVYDVYFAPSGDYVIIAMEDCGHSISNASPGGVVSFYNKGHELARYRDSQLPWCFIFKGLVNYALERDFIQFENTRFDPQNLTYSVKTNQSEEFVFDVTTGAIIRRWSPWPFYLGGAFLIVPIVVFGLYRIETRIGATKGELHRRQFSVQEMLFLVTAICVLLWLASVNGILAAVCFIIALGGGTIPWICSRSRRAWLSGAILSLYGGFIGLFCWACLVDIRRDGPNIGPSILIGTFVILVSTGVIGGAVIPCWIEKKRLPQISRVQ